MVCDWIPEYFTKYNTFLLKKKRVWTRIKSRLIMSQLSAEWCFGEKAVGGLLAGGRLTPVDQSKYFVGYDAAVRRGPL